MKVTMKKLAMVSATILPASTLVFGGGSMGGGGPPALEHLEVMLMSQPLLDGGLFSDADGKIGLLTRNTNTIQPQMSVTRLGSSQVISEPGLRLQSLSLKFPDSDLDTLRIQTKPVDAAGPQGQNFSFEVLEGDTADAVILKDRRALMRESVEASKGR